MPSDNGSSILEWEMTEGAFILYRNGDSWGSMVHQPPRYDVNIGPCSFQLSRKGLIEPRLTVNGPCGQELGRATSLNRFELRIELVDGGCYLHRELKEGLQNYTIFDCQGNLVMETQNKSTWKSPSMHIDLCERGLSDQDCAYLAAISLFIFLDRSKWSSHLSDCIL